MKKLILIFLVLSACAVHAAGPPPILRNRYTTNANPGTATATNATYLLNEEWGTNGFLSGDYMRARMPVPQRAWGTWNDMPDGYPPLGPSNDQSWATSTNINETYCIVQADWFRTNGMLAAGWTHLILEEGWHTGLDSNGRYVEDTTKFPNGVGYVARYWKDSGFVPGIYKAVQPLGGGLTCEGYAATSYTNLFNHFTQTSDWGFEFYFIDACGAYDQFWRGSGLPGAPTTLAQEINQRERLINNAIARTRKNIGWLSVGTQNGATESGQFSPYSFSQHNVYFPHPGGPSAMGRWDFLLDDFQGIIDRAYTNAVNGWTAYTYPGHYFYQGQLNDNGPFTTNTYQMAFSLQCMMAAAIYINSESHRRYSVGDSNLAPYLGPIANPPSTWYTASRDRLLTNQEIAAVHQDAAVIAGRRIWSNSLAEVWWRPVGANAETMGLSDEHALLVINRSTTNKSVEIPYSLFSRPGLMRVRDLVNLRTLGDYTNAITIDIQPTNSAFLRLARLPVYMEEERTIGFQSMDVNGTGVSKITLATAGPSPFWLIDGLVQSAGNASDAKVIFPVPMWATNCQVRYLGFSAYAGVAAWTNTFFVTITTPTTRWLLGSSSFAGITNTHYQTVNATATWSTNYCAIPLTNAPKSIELHLLTGTNASARYIFGPLQVKFQGHKQF